MGGLGGVYNSSDRVIRALTFSFCRTHLKTGPKDAGAAPASLGPIFGCVRQKLKVSDANYAVRTEISDSAGRFCLFISGRYSGNGPSYGGQSSVSHGFGRHTTHHTDTHTTHPPKASSPGLGAQGSGIGDRGVSSGQWAVGSGQVGLLVRGTCPLPRFKTRP